MPYNDSLMEPEPTYSGGRAVQSATDRDGREWQYDDTKGNWVNLATGEAVSPSTFSQMAGRSGNSADNTMMLAEAMKREEAALNPGPSIVLNENGESNRPKASAAQRNRGQAVMDAWMGDAASIMSPEAKAQLRPMEAARNPVVPPSMTQPAMPTMNTATMAAPRQSPVMPPQQRSIVPPYNPAEVAGVLAQLPVPSTVTQPSPEKALAYRRYLADQGYKRDQASGMPAKILNAKWLPVYSALNTSGGPTMQKPMTAYQQNMADHRKFLEEEALKKSRATELKNLTPPVAKLSQLDTAELYSGIKRFDALEKEGRTKLNEARGAAATETDSNKIEIATVKGRLAADQIRSAQIGRQNLLQKFRVPPVNPIEGAMVSPAPSPTVEAPAVKAINQSKGALTLDKGKEFLRHANGDKARARQLARDAGYEL